MQILDTQIISYAFNGTTAQVRDQKIASVTAKEFLLAQEDGGNKVGYYVPLPTMLAIEIGSDLPFPKIDHPFSKRHTDQVILEVGGGFLTVIQHGNLAIATIINSKARSLFVQCMRFLEKDKRKLRIEKFDFLIEIQFHVFHSIETRLLWKFNFSMTLFLYIIQSKMLEVL